MKRGSKRRRASRTSSVIKEQSESVVRGDHPIAFVLPTVRFLFFNIKPKKI